MRKVVRVFTCVRANETPCACARCSQVVQTLTELNLSIKRARISSDGGWFVDGESQHATQCQSLAQLLFCALQLRLHDHLAHTEFFVSETPRGKVTDARKLNLIKQVSALYTCVGMVH